MVVLLAARWLQGFLNRLSDGKELTSLLDRVPGQIDLIEGIAAVLAALCWLPLIWAAWSILAGLVDCVATRVRIGLVAAYPPAQRRGPVLERAQPVRRPRSLLDVSRRRRRPSRVGGRVAGDGAHVGAARRAGARAGDPVARIRPFVRAGRHGHAGRTARSASSNPLQGNV